MDMQSGPVPPPTLGRVLVVEDEYYLADDLVSALTQAGAAVVGPAASCADALQLLDDNVEAAVLDVSLRGESVYEVAEALRRRRIPFVFVTGYDPATLPERFSDTPHLRKPVDPRQLLEFLLAEARTA